MKRGTLVVNGDKRVVWEDQVMNAVESLGRAPIGRNDRTLIRSIVKDWIGRHMDEPVLRDMPVLNPEQVQTILGDQP